MKTKSSDQYLTNYEWFADVLNDESVILCYGSALECLELFTGYLGESEIDVYAKEKGIYENINYRIVDNFDGIETVKVGNLLCTSIDQTINDMLHDFDEIDEQALIEGLSRYYFMNGESFKGLKVLSENMEIFNRIKDWAIEYYDDESDKRIKI